MRYKVTFNRIVTEAQLVEGVIEADDLEAASEKFSTNDFQRFLIVKREAQDINTGRPDFEEIT